MALDVGLGDSLAASLAASLADSLGASDGEAVGDSVSRSALPEAVGDAAPVGELDGLGGADVTAGDDGLVVGDSRSPSDRVGEGTLGVRVAVRVTEAVTLGVGRSPLPSPPHAASRNKMHATAPTRTPCTLGGAPPATNHPPWMRDATAKPGGTHPLGLSSPATSRCIASATPAASSP